MPISTAKAKTHGVAIDDIFDTMQVYLGSLYANDFNRFGRTYQVNVRPTRSSAGTGADRPAEGTQQPRRDGPAVDLRQRQDSAGPDRVMHYNGFLTAEINGAAAPGYSSGRPRRPWNVCSRPSCPTA